MDETAVLELFVIRSALTGALWCGILWLVAVWSPLAKSNLWRPIVKSLAIIVGVGLPAMAGLVSVAHLYL